MQVSIQANDVSSFSTQLSLEMSVATDGCLVWPPVDGCLVWPPVLFEWLVQHLHKF